MYHIFLSIFLLFLISSPSFGDYVASEASQGLNRTKDSYLVLRRPSCLWTLSFLSFKYIFGTSQGDVHLTSLLCLQLLVAMAKHPAQTSQGKRGSLCLRVHRGGEGTATGVAGTVLAGVCSMAWLVYVWEQATALHSLSPNTHPH